MLSPMSIFLYIYIKSNRVAYYLAKYKVHIETN